MLFVDSTDSTQLNINSGFGDVIILLAKCLH